MSTAPFDPVAYKRTTTDQWQTAAEPWHRWAPTLEAWLGDATETMLDMTGVTRTARVLDGEQLDVQPGTFDAVISRVGFIYFPDQHAAFVGMRLALRPGGRLAGIVYSTPEANGFFSIPVSIIRRRAQLPAPAQGQPGPFSLGAPGVIEAALERAGFTDVEARRVAAPLRLPSTAEFVGFARESFGALHQMLAGLSEAEREEAWSEIERELSRYETAGGFEGPCELLVAAGTAPT